MREARSLKDGTNILRRDPSRKLLTSVQANTGSRPEASTDACHFKSVSQTRMNVIVLRHRVNLRLPLKSSEGA